MSKSSDKPSFFIFNTSPENVCLSDLALTVPAGRCYDLLNDNFNYTIEQLKKSLKDGSLHIKRNKVKLIHNRPKPIEPPPMELSTIPIITRNRSAVKIEEPVFDELIFSDEDYANMMADEFEE